MGQETAETTETEETLEQETDELSEEEVATATDETESETEETQEFEVVRETGTQPAKDSEPAWIKARLSQISAKKNDALKAVGEANSALDLEREKNKLLQMRIDQQDAAGQQLAPPNQDDYDGGTLDPDYLRKKQEYDNAIIQAEVSRQVAATARTTTEQANQGIQSQDLERKRIKHYQRANEAGAKNFDATEDKAIELLGSGVVDYIVGNFDDSHVLIKYLGTDKNADEARKLRALAESNEGLAIAEIGYLRAVLKPKVKSKKPPAGPDEDLEGGTLPTQGKRGPKGATYS